MARAYGWNAQLLLAFESTYGTPPVSGFKKLPFISRTLSAEQGLIASTVIGLGRDPAQPYQDVINVEGDIVVPVDVRNIGQWLKALFGAPTTTGASAPYSHMFKSGATSLPSLALETGLPQIPAYFMVAGVRANSIAFNFTRSGEATATINCIGQGETRTTTSQGGTPTQANYTRFSQFQGAIKQGGSALANVTSASVTYSNTLEKIETIRSDGKLDGVDPGIAALTGSLAVRYADNTLIDLASAGTPVDLEFSYSIDANNKLTILCHEVYLPKPKLGIDGPGGIEASYDFQGAKNTAANAMVTVTLVNDVASY